MSQAKMDWYRLMSGSPLGGERKGGGRNPFLQDLDRIVFSSAFRRLQDKTQVHPLAPGGRVRTRLTHSLEVASVGRDLGFGVGATLVDRHNLEGLSAHDFGYVVQAACLAHDIGNPPFGHAGEDAIASWFAKHQDLLAGLDGDQRADFTAFEGNAQGFRILTTLEKVGDAGGLQLTCATLGAFTKYPGGAAAAAQGVLKKHGHFQAEARQFETLAGQLGLVRRNAPVAAWHRHPLAYLTEAADDICYSVADLEDGVEMGCVSFAEAERHLAPLARHPGKYQGDAEARWQELRRADWYAGRPEREKLGFLRGKAIGNLVGEVVETFLSREDAILQGHLEGSLLGACALAGEIKACKDFADTAIFGTGRKIAMEVGGFEVLGALLDAFCEAVIEPEPSPRGERLLKLVPGLARSHGRYAALLSVTDMVAGLSDHDAVALSRTIRGVGL